MVNALWADRLTTKKSIGKSPYQLVYGIDAVFPSSLGVLVMKIIQEFQVEPNDIQRRINQTIHLQQTREEVYVKSQVIQDKIKKIFDKKTEASNFYIGDKLFKWDSRRVVRANMANLISYVKALISFMVTEVTMYFS